MKKSTSAAQARSRSRKFSSPNPSAAEPSAMAPGTEPLRAARLLSILQNRVASAMALISTVQEELPNDASSSEWSTLNKACALLGRVERKLDSAANAAVKAARRAAEPAQQARYRGFITSEAERIGKGNGAGA